MLCQSWGWGSGLQQVNVWLWEEVVHFNPFELITSN